MVNEVEYITIGKRILTKGLIACRAVIEDRMIPSAACCYWRLDDPFAAYIAANTPNAFQWARQSPKIARSRGDSRSPLTHGSLYPPSLPSNRHLDQFSRFCRGHERDQQTTHWL